jgi:cysteine-rich repeat protein
LLLLVAALFLVVGAASVQDASAAASQQSLCKKEQCKAPKKNCLNWFKAEYKADKADCKNLKAAGIDDCKAEKEAELIECGTDKQCKKQVKKGFKACKKDANKAFKACNKDAGQTKKTGMGACKKGSKDCNFCCNTAVDVRGCTIIGCGDGVKIPQEECDDGNTTSGDGCRASCTIEECGDGIIDGPSEECDTTNDGCPATHACIPLGDRDECTCAAPCELDPVPTKLKFTTILPEGVCGCTLRSPDDTSCDGASKIGDLECGDLLVGGGLSATPPGPTPDGATTFVEFTECRGTELIIGPSAGDGEKTCSFGTDDGGGPCYYGPALPVVNNTDAMSACVLNTLKKNIEGTTDPTTGHATLENVDLNSEVFLTGDLIKNTCRGGTNPGAPCVFGGTTCDGICAVQRTAVCEGGAKDGEDCTYSVCVGGTLEGNACTNDAFCLGGGTCQGICPDNEFCTDDSDCGTGTCSVNDCPGGTCKQSSGTVEACPICVNESFEPITQEGMEGTCNLGVNKGQSCRSANSAGLTIDCPPAADTFLANINVTIPAITTGTAELIAGEDGTFCNFGECFGGDRDFERCQTSRDCPGGFCQKLCQVLGGPDPNDPNNDPSCEIIDDCEEPGQTTWRPCGQSEIGAFIRSAGDDDTPVGGPEVRRVILTGTPAPAPVLIGETKPSKLVAAFCIPRTGEQEVDNAGSLPGPGATSLAGTVTLMGE